LWANVWREGVRVAARADPRSPPQPAQQLADARRGERLVGLVEEQPLPVNARPALGEVGADGPPCGAADRHDALGGSLPRDLDRSVGAQVAEADADHLAQPQASVEQQQQHRAVALGGAGQQPAQVGVGQRLDQLPWHPRPGQRAQRPGGSQPVGAEPVAERAQATHIAGHAHRRQAGAQLDQPRPQLRRGQRVDRALGAKAPRQPLADHAVPDDGPRR